MLRKVIAAVLICLWLVPSSVGLLQAHDRADYSKGQKLGRPYHWGGKEAVTPPQSTKAQPSHSVSWQASAFHPPVIRAALRADGRIANPSKQRSKIYKLNQALLI